MKKYYSIILLWGIFSYAQVGIKTTTPNSTLTVNGSLGADYKQITATTYSITATDHYLTYDGDRQHNLYSSRNRDWHDRFYGKNL